LTARSTRKLWPKIGYLAGRAANPQKSWHFLRRPGHGRRTRTRSCDSRQPAICEPSSRPGYWADDLTRHSATLGAGIAVGALVAGAVLSYFGAPAQRAQRPVVGAAAAPTTAAAPLKERDDDLAERIAALETQLAEERERRIDLARQIDEVYERIASAGDEAAPATEYTADADGRGSVDEETVREAVDYSKSRMERALISAGLDESLAAEIKRRGDEVAMTEMYLRDQATREGWIDTPRFEEEMEALAAERTDLREELGDDAYDRYLFAMGQRNRVIVNDVMINSAAEEVGLQQGDLIVGYGDQRVFFPEDLVSQTHSGDIGEPVVLRVIRQQEPVEIEVPRGPLGVRIGGAQDDPEIR